MSHPRQTFDAQLRALEGRLLELGDVVEGMLEDAVKALAEQDAGLAEAVVRRDDVADAADLEIETTSMHLLALQQPMAKDLRIIGTALKITTDLERIGDYSVDIALLAQELTNEPFHTPLVRIPRMAEIAIAMVRGALQAFVSRDLAQVDAVIQMDDRVDALYYETRDYLIEEMKNPDNVWRGAHLLLAARYLERIADHTVNVAERVYYMETGVLIQLSESHKHD
jgi:phosphate transport system protein